MNWCPVIQCRDKFESWTTDYLWCFSENKRWRSSTDKGIIVFYVTGAYCLFTQIHVRGVQRVKKWLDYYYFCVFCGVDGALEKSCSDQIAIFIFIRKLAKWLIIWGLSNGFFFLGCCLRKDLGRALDWCQRYLPMPNENGETDTFAHFEPNKLKFVKSVKLWSGVKICAFTLRKKFTLFSCGTSETIRLYIPWVQG